MVQAFVVVLQHRLALDFPGAVVGVGVYYVAGEDLLPEGEAAGGAWESAKVWLVKLGEAVVLQLGAKQSGTEGSPPPRPYPDAMLGRAGVFRVMWKRDDGMLYE